MSKSYKYEMKQQAKKYRAAARYRVAAFFIALSPGTVTLVFVRDGLTFGLVLITTVVVLLAWMVAKKGDELERS